jgi:uncharacterized protein YuzE
MRQSRLPVVVTAHRTSQIKKKLRKAMKVKYDQEVDVLRIRFSSAAVDQSDEEKTWHHSRSRLDYDIDGNIVGIEILNASRRMQYPPSHRDRCGRSG